MLAFKFLSWTLILSINFNYLSYIYFNIFVSTYLFSFFLGFLQASLDAQEVFAKYSCPYCPYSTYYKTNLQAHERTHTGERPFNCELCQKSFMQKIHLDQHLQSFSHTGQRPFSCLICNKGFTRKSYLKKHICNSL